MVIGLAAVVWAGSALAGAGEAGGPLLAAPVGARPLALGASYAALADDALALLWNPAGLASVRMTEASLTWERAPGEVTLGHLLYARPLLGRHGVGAGVGTLRTGDIQYETLAGEPASLPGQADWLAVAGGAMTLVPCSGPPSGDRFSALAGAAVKWLRTSVGSLRGQTPAADVGGLVTMPVLPGPFPLRVGVVWQNAGGRVKLGGESDAAASPVRVGVAQSVLEGPGLWTTATVEAMRLAAGADLEWHVGVEQAWVVGPALAVAGRLGGRLGADLPGLSAGLGVRWDSFVLDYAMARLGELGWVYRAGLKVRWR